jgi:hypothetical protein
MVVGGDSGQLDPGCLNSRRGAIAQLAERRLCKAEVAGSIPAGSTSSRVNFESTVAARTVIGYGRDWDADSSGHHFAAH